MASWFMRLSLSVKAPAELLCFLWDGEGERGRLSAFLRHTCSHGHEQRALFSTDRSWVRDPLPSIALWTPLPQSIMNMSLFLVVSLKYGQMRTQTQHWMKCWHTSNAKIWPLTQSLKSLKHQFTTHQRVNQERLIHGSCEYSSFGLFRSNLK